MEAFFPFTISLPYDLVPIFRKADKGTWYQAVLRVEDRTKGTVLVYGMRDTFYGGRGELKREVPIEWPDGAINSELKSRAANLAARMIEEEDRKALKKRHDAAFAEIMASISKPHINEAAQ